MTRVSWSRRGTVRQRPSRVVAAARRFCWIDEHGAEVADDDPDRWGYHTPSYVAAFHSAAGLALVVDTKGDLPRAQGEAMVAVLTEELAARGVPAHIDAMPRGLSLGEEIPLWWSTAVRCPGAGRRRVRF